jgi:DNA polymerase III delta prime subunit
MKTQQLWHILLVILTLLGVMAVMYADVAFSATQAVHADRAVEIAKRSRDRIENSGKVLKESSETLFFEFARRTGELQKLLDTRQQLENAGMLSKDDALGRARLAHINAGIIAEVGKLKQVCDTNLDDLLTALELFDRAIADAVVDTQSTRSINSNYELILNQFKNSEQHRFLEAAQTAEDLLEQIRETSDPVMKQRLESKYNRLKMRLNQIRQRRMIYESRLKVAAMNQRVSDKIREKIRQEGGVVPSKFRSVMAGLYTTFAKVVPVAETGGTGFAGALEDLGFETVAELSDTLDIVSASTGKLDQVLDRMVNDVISDLDGIQVMDDQSIRGGAISFEDEMEFISRERAAWTKG